METLGNVLGKKFSPNLRCESCDITCSSKKDMDIHLSTLKHKKITNGNEIYQKNVSSYHCESCDYKCCHLSHWNRHIKTEKHLETVGKLFTHEHKCSCGKKYKTRSGLWKHKNVCKDKNNNNLNPIFVNSNDDEEGEIDINEEATLVWTLVKQNQEFKEMMLEQQNYMMELVKNSNTVNNTTIYNNANTNNTQNNQFNLQFFLNETCKDAMNINEFIDSIQIQLEDLDYTGKHGYVKGLSNVIVRELKALDQKVRPMHCSDEKREVIYIKTNDVWEKDIDYAGVTRFTKHLAHKKFLKIKEWVEENPTCMAHDDKKNDDYLNILGQITSSFTHLNGSECQESMKKIIKAIAKQAIIQKNISN